MSSWLTVSRTGECGTCGVRVPVTSDFRAATHWLRELLRVVRYGPSGPVVPVTRRALCAGSGAMAWSVTTRVSLAVSRVRGE